MKDIVKFKKSLFTCSRSSILTTIERTNEKTKKIHKRTRSFIPRNL